MKTIAKQNNLDTLVFGHTHRSSVKLAEIGLFINTGRPADPLPTFITKPTVVLLKRTKENVEPEIIEC